MMAHDLNETDLVERRAAVHGLLQACSNLRVEYQRRSRDNAPNHNVFRLLRIERSEVGLHSPFLADLLDPFGSHGQGTVFLRNFFDMLARHEQKFVDLTAAVRETAPPSEWIVERERGRIDISIRSRRAGLLMFIENKIDAGEQYDQLTRYRSRLERQGSYDHRFLVYLSPKNSGQPQTGTPHICLTYEEDIVKWLKSCAIPDMPKHVLTNLQQYLEIISNL